MQHIILKYMKDITRKSLRDVDILQIRFKCVEYESNIALICNLDINIISDLGGIEKI